MARSKQSSKDTPIEAPKTPVDALAGGRGGTKPARPEEERARVAQKSPSRSASGAGAPRATKRVSGTKTVQRQVAAKEKRDAKQGALRIGSGTSAKQTTQRRSNKGGRATGGP